jgi:hypothetical protein
MRARCSAASSRWRRSSVCMGRGTACSGLGAQQRKARSGSRLRMRAHLPPLTLCRCSLAACRASARLQGAQPCLADAAKVTTGGQPVLCNAQRSCERHAEARCGCQLAACCCAQPHTPATAIRQHTVRGGAVPSVWSTPTRTHAGKAGGSEKKKVSKATKAGLQFPVGRLARCALRGCAACSGRMCLCGHLAPHAALLCSSTLPASTATTRRVR